MMPNHIPLFAGNIFFQINSLHMTLFSELGLRQELLEGVERLGFTEPTKVQELAIPTILESAQDLVALAQTGTGKQGLLDSLITQNRSRK